MIAYPLGFVKGCGGTNIFPVVLFFGNFCGIMQSVHKYQVLSIRQAVGSLYKQGGSFFWLPPCRRGVLLMTFSELMQFCTVIIQIINVCVNISNNKKK